MVGGPPLRADHAERASGADVVDVVADEVLVGAVLAVTGYGAVDKAGVEGAEGVVVAAEALNHAGAEALDEHVGVFAEAAQDVLSFGHLEVEGDAALVAVERGEGGAAALLALVRLVGAAHAGTADASAARLLDADDVRSEVAQHHGAEATGGHAREVDDADVGELQGSGDGGVHRMPPCCC